MHFTGKILIAAVFSIPLAACEPGVVSEGTEFQRKYSTARKALEAGNYDSAIRSYGALLPNAGPLEPRLRLEYAHALLRGGRYDEAAQVAATLASDLSGSDRAAALAVRGTALHESALAEMRMGAAGRGTVEKLRAADAALQNMLALDAGMDPLGAMASRRSDIRREIAQLGG
jgi:thioredoxin-like negative regulator of GroEL